MKLLTEKQVEQEYGIKVRTLQKWRWAGGGIPYYKLGRSVRYKAADIEQYLAERRRVSTSDQSAETI